MFIRCKIKDCVREKGVICCFEFSQFPCRFYGKTEAEILKEGRL